MGSLTDAFAEMLTSKNSSAKERYLGCLETFKDTCGHRAQYKSDAQTAWMNVERRLRKIVPEAIKEEKFAKFVDATEHVLMKFATVGVLPFAQEIPEALKLALRSPLRIEVGKRTSRRVSKCHDNDVEEEPVHLEKQLIFPLVDSSFFRLLVHVCAQYHGLKSTSIKLKKLGQKDIIVALRNSNKLCHGIPLRNIIRTIDNARENYEGQSVEGIDRNEPCELSKICSMEEEPQTEDGKLNHSKFEDDSDYIMI